MRAPRVPPNQSTAPDNPAGSGVSVSKRHLSAVFALAAAAAIGQTTAPSDPPPEGPTYKFRSDVSLARIDAQVVDENNRPIRGLSAQDFVLREDGKPQEIRNFQSENMPVDVLLLLDVSRSMEPHVQRIASAAHQALRALGDQDRIAILVFDRATRVRMGFRASRADAERELARVLDDETFEGGTDITRGLLDAADYMTQHARRDARRAIVILTDDQTERDRNEAAVSRALTRADSVLSALIAPDALHTGSANRRPMWPDDDRLRQWFGDVLPPGFGSFGMGPRTQSAGTSRIANRSGGDSMTVDDAGAFQETLARIRERYALYWYLPEGEQPGDPRSVEVDLSDAARRRYPGARINSRRSHIGPNGTSDPDHPRPVRVSFPVRVLD
jgi:VWFA-related protein